MAKTMDDHLFELGQVHVFMIKSAGDATTTHSLAGRLYLSRSGWLMLDVPNALVRGTFDALHEPGAELPPTRGAFLNAHISVMTKEEVDAIGADKLTERGHQFHYTLGPLKVVEPKGWGDMSKCWFIEVNSPELKNLRKSYGLTPLPHGDHEFHITIAVRRKHVLHNNDVKKKSTEYKAAGVLTNAARVGGLALDVAGLKALGGSNTPEEPDPATVVENDNSYLNQLRSKKRKKVPSAVAAVKAAAEVLPVPPHRQETNYSCGPGAYASIAKLFGIDHSEKDLRKEMRSDPQAGTDPAAIVRAAQNDGLNVTARNGMTLDELRAKIDTGVPVIVDIQAYDTDKNLSDDDSGHYVTLTGYDDKYFYFRDPAKGDETGKLTPEELDARWHDETGDGTKTNHLGIAVDDPAHRITPTETQPKAEKIANSL